MDELIRGEVGGALLQSPRGLRCERLPKNQRLQPQVVDERTRSIDVVAPRLQDETPVAAAVTGELREAANQPIVAFPQPRVAARREHKPPAPRRRGPTIADLRRWT